jgi:two-component system phosphate regulon response regulator PhoB
MTDVNRILVVDDEVTLVKLCQIIFENAGYQVRGALSGHQALEMITEEMPDLILLDVMMPVMTGIELCRQIRAQHPATRPCILMYTADDREETREHSIAAGADAVITKATPVFELPAKISPFIEAGCQG